MNCSTHPTEGQGTDTPPNRRSERPSGGDVDIDQRLRIGGRAMIDGAAGERDNADRRKRLS
jgi:hypothetical protein